MSKLLYSEAVLSFTANEDQSAKRGYFVNASSGSAALVTAVTDDPIGVIVDGNSAGAKTAVALWNQGGVALVKCNASAGSIALGTFLALCADGTVKADPGTGTRTLVGLATEAGANNALIGAVLCKPVHTPVTPSAMSVTANEDQTGKEGYFVKASSGKGALCTAATDVPLGVINAGGASTSSVVLPGGGIVPAKTNASAGSITLGTYLTVCNDGTVKADPGSGDRVRVAIALASAGNSALVNVLPIPPVAITAT